MHRERAMDTNSSAKKMGTAVKTAVVIVTFFVAATAPLKPAYSQDESFDVSYYKGIPTWGNYVGQPYREHSAKCRAGL
jgi:hypothetical protein